MIDCGSIRWSNITNIGTSRCCGPPYGYCATIFGAGVSNENETAFFSVCPVALFVPSGIVILYVVDCGKRGSGSNRIVRVPIQRHLPFGCGSSFTGWVFAASSCDVTATRGWLNVTLSSGAYGISPSGM
jgi:hypothetical protein